MNCRNRIAVQEMETGRTAYRCGLDREMRVNRRMHCEKWNGRTTFAIGTGGIRHEKTR